MNATEDLLALRGIIEEQSGEGPLENLGLFMMPLDRADGRTFAASGGDGVEFAFATSEDAAGRPVVMRVPMAKQKERIVGTDLRDFLALGRYSGFFVLEQLQYKFERTTALLAARRFPDWLTRNERRTLDRIAKEFALKPIDDPASHLATLAEKFAQD